MSVYDDLLKVEKTIKSCKTEDQLKNASRFANNFIKFYKERIDALGFERYFRKLILYSKSKAIKNIIPPRCV